MMQKPKKKEIIQHSTATNNRERIGWNECCDAWEAYLATRQKEGENNKHLLKMMTVRMEEYGMPVFKDQFPAMDILQLVRDAGLGRGEDFEIDERKAEDEINYVLEQFYDIFVEPETVRYLAKHLSARSAEVIKRKEKGNV